MTDCDVDVEPEEPEEYEVLVQDAAPSVATVQAPAAVVVVPGAIEQPLVVPQAAPSVLATATLDEIVALVERTRSAVASLQVSELTGADRRKLDSIHWGARNDPIVVHRLWDRCGAESTRSSGDSAPYVGSGSLYEIGCGLLVEGSFCDHGWLLFQFVATATTRFAAANMLVEFTLETADLPDPEDEDPEVAGTWPAFTTHKAWGSKSVGATPDGTEFVCVMALHARGHVDGAWNQTYDGYMKWDDPAASPEEAIEQKFLRALTTTIDPTVSKTIRSQFRITNQYTITKSAMDWTHATKTLSQTGAWAGYTPVAGDLIVITAAPVIFDPGVTAGVVLGTYTIASKTNDDDLVLNEHIAFDTDGTTPVDVGGDGIACTIQVNFFDVKASRAYQIGPAVGSLN